MPTGYLKLTLYLITQLVIPQDGDIGCESDPMRLTDYQGILIL